MLSIIIPIYNEYDNIIRLYNAIVDVVNKNKIDYEIIYIDDGSKDKSIDILQEIARNNQKVKIISFTKNFGQTAALSAGFNNASGDIIIPMDGDYQNDPNDIPKFIEKINEGYDVVSGWRKNRKDKTFTRKIPSKIANKIISYIGGVHIHDYGCTMKAYKSEFIKDIKLYGEMHRFIPIYAKWEGAKITEIIVNHLPRKFGRSKYGLNRTIKVILDILLIKFLEKYTNKPIYIFGGFAFLSFFMSILSFFVMLYLKFWGRKDFVQTPLPSIAVTFFLISILSFIIGLLAEMLTRTYYESQNKLPYKIKSKLNF